ncbi:hypothetical protein [Saccharothrix texasensis]|uniref:hypothetical protein n=1 Tax=Saccharothrix texasensis TaxID=103734 RepID=UPI001FEB9AC7|nr:hypothetical protein [Saccharothrix texasensis]
MRARAHEFTNHLHVISGLVELDRRDDAHIERVGGAGSVTSDITLPRHLIHTPPNPASPALPTRPARPAGQ